MVSERQKDGKLRIVQRKDITGRESGLLLRYSGRKWQISTDTQCIKMRNTRRRSDSERGRGHLGIYIRNGSIVQHVVKSLWVIRYNGKYQSKTSYPSNQIRWKLNIHDQNGTFESCRQFHGNEQELKDRRIHISASSQLTLIDFCLWGRNQFIVCPFLSYFPFFF